MSDQLIIGILIGLNLGLVTGIVAFGMGVISGLKKAGKL